MKWLNSFSEFCRNLTVTEGVLIILSVLLYRGIIKSYERQLDERQHEIDRLAKENREYRDRFMRFVDSNLTLDSNQKVQ